MTPASVTRPAVVRSDQQGIHPDLNTAVNTHLHHRYRRPFAAHNLDAFARLQERVAAAAPGIILDSGCGTGESSAHFATRHPRRLVIGIDKSAVRIEVAKSRYQRENLIFERADCIDLWRLAARARWPVQRHYLLYPNPWPKRKQLRRRWYGHPIFPALLQLGGRLELRTNWAPYAHDFCHALTLAGIPSSQLRCYAPVAAITAFERKYAAAAHTLYRLVSKLNRTG